MTGTRILLDATVLYELGMVGELELLSVFEGDLVAPEAVVAEVDVEPAATNIDRFLDEHGVGTDARADGFEGDALALLGDEESTGDAMLVAALLAAREAGEPAALISDDRRLRAIADGLGATVTGTFGVVVRASTEDKYFPTSQAKRVLRRTDAHGVQMTGQLRERAIGEVD
jgi:predicted nucleic acid-binding protein